MMANTWLPDWFSLGTSNDLQLITTTATTDIVPGGLVYQEPKGVHVENPLMVKDLMCDLEKSKDINKRVKEQLESKPLPIVSVSGMPGLLLGGIGGISRTRQQMNQLGQLGQVQPGDWITTF